MNSSRIIAVCADQSGHEQWRAFLDQILPQAGVSVVACDRLQSISRHEEIACLLVLMDEDGPLAAALRFKMQRPKVRMILLNRLEDARAGGLVIHEQQAVPFEQVLRTLKQVLDDPQSPPAAPKDADAPEPMPSSQLVDRLSEKELEILRLTAEGLSIKEIAHTLSRAYGTVTRHRANLMNKLNLHDKVALTRYAIRTGLAKA